MSRSAHALALALAVLFASALAACGDEIKPDPCLVSACPLPAAPRCDGNTQVVQGAAVCSNLDGTAHCEYGEARTDCGVSGMTCAEGACHPAGDPCIGKTCATPPAATCAQGVATTYDLTGTCDGASGAAECTYASHTTDCAAAKQVCMGGACVDPCTGMTCVAPPSPTCTNDTLTTYAETGTCDGSTGHAVCTYAPATTDCATTDKACSGGACVDPCVGFACTSPPVNSCTAGVFTTYAAVGTCSSPGGVPACAYAPASISCVAIDQACSPAGGCFDPCVGFACTTPPVNTCDQSTLTSYANPGACSAPGGVPGCTYAPATTDCATQDKVCDPGAGACADPCVGFACTTPPAASCAGNSLNIFPATGTCASPGGVPACDYAPIVTDCAAQDHVCDPGTTACVDPCIGVVCSTPPAPTCAGPGNTLARTFAADGTCASPGGVVECDYAPTDVDCALTGQGCAAATCTGPVLFARIQFPASITDVATTSQTVYGRIFVAGVTDQTGGNDPNPNVVVEVGVGAGTDPTAWTWTPALPNASYGPGSPGYEGNNDEYQGTIVVPAGPGTTPHYGVRLSNDAGATWLYGDVGDAGSSDGFKTPGDLHVAAPYFTEYMEGLSNNKAVEIYNPGSIGVALAGCFVDIYTNGATTASSIALTATATIAAGDVFVLCHSSYALADVAQCDQKTGSANWNGDDVVALRCASGNLDIIGKIGEDPGAEWGTGLVSTMDNTLLRACTTSSGDLDGSDAFDPSAQWQGYVANTSFLGARNCPLP